MTKTVVITGAGVGLGRALARKFARDGDNVVLLGRTFAKIEAVAAELGTTAQAIACDVASPDSVRTAFTAIADRHPAIDVLINNAAVYEPFTVAEATDSQIMAPLLINLAGPIYCARAAIPLMGKGGHIINVSSESVTVNWPMLALYQTSKAGLERLTETLGQELKPLGIRVTTIRAGQMHDEDKVSTWTPEASQRFGKACLEIGINPRGRPMSHFNSVAEVFRMVVDTAADVQLNTVVVEGRHADDAAH